MRDVFVIKIKLKMIIFCIWHFTTKKCTKKYCTFIIIHYYKNIPIICKQIKEHCKSSVNIDSDKLTNSFLKTLNKNFHRTNKNNSYTFNEYFKEHHITHFKKLFPKDTLKILGYVDE